MKDRIPVQERKASSCFVSSFLNRCEPSVTQFCNQRSTYPHSMASVYGNASARAVFHC